MPTTRVGFYVWCGAIFLVGTAHNFVTWIVP